MRIEGAIPNHVARAYGVNPTRPQRVAPAAPANAPAPAQAPVARTAPTLVEAGRAPQRTDAIAKVDQAADAARVGRLFAGRVAGGVQFDADGQSRASGAMQMYSRAADLVEVAVGVGRTIDLHG